MAIPSWAMDSVDLLPIGINSPALKVGTYSNIDERYNQHGQLMSLTDIHSIEFNVQTLSRIEPQVTELVSALNSFGTGNYGNQLNLGVLKINSQPSVQYWAPVHAWGITSKWTLGFGVPVIKYQNEASLASEGGNLAAYKQQYSGISTSLDKAFQRLDVSIDLAAQAELEKKGYKPIGRREQTFVGDIQIVSLYDLGRTANLASAWKMVVNLPTGPKADPSDLLALDMFGETAVENHLMGQYRFAKSLVIRGKGGYRYVLPDQVEKRVPLSDLDSLPGEEGQEKVTRQKGGSLIAGSSLGYEINQSWSIDLGYEFLQKEKDHYSGGRGRYYSALERNTDQITHRSKLGIAYSSVKSYFSKKALIPSIFSLELSDVFSGKNVARQSLSEVTVMLFY